MPILSIYQGAIQDTKHPKIGHANYNHKKNWEKNKVRYDLRWKETTHLISQTTS